MTLRIAFGEEGRAGDGKEDDVECAREREEDVREDGGGEGDVMRMERPETYHSNREDGYSINQGIEKHLHRNGVYTLRRLGDRTRNINLVLLSFDMDSVSVD